MSPLDAEASALVARHLVGRSSDFADALRRSGLSVTTEEIAAAMEAVRRLDLAEPDSLYWGMRIAIVRGPDDLPTFDRVFREFWHRPTPAAERRRAEPEQLDEGRAGVARTVRSGEGDEEGELAEQAIYSAHEVSRRKDFADFDQRELELLAEWLGAIDFEGPWRRSRRRRAGVRGPIDLRRTLRAGFRTSGHPVRRVHRAPRRKHRQLTFVCDVSGSMERYSRALLMLAHAVARQRGRVAAFGFATSLTELTAELREAEPAKGVAAAASKVADWSGGTRMGPCLNDLVRDRGGAVRGAAVVLVSDGWDLGDPDELRGAMSALRRLAHTVIWVNPHLQDPAFEPLTQGMAAAMPFIDHFLPCHNLQSLAPLFSLLEEL